MSTLLDLAKICLSADKNKSKRDKHIDEEVLHKIGFYQYDYNYDCREINMYDDTRMWSMYIAPSWCTDQVVGLKLYFYNDTVFAYSRQSARKSDIIVSFIDNVLLIKEIMAYLETLVVVDDVDFLEGLNLKPLDKDFGLGYNINYNDCSLGNKNCYFNGKKATVIKYFKEDTQWHLDKKISIQFKDDNTIEIVNISDVIFDWLPY